MEKRFAYDKACMKNPLVFTNWTLESERACLGRLKRKGAPAELVSEQTNRVLKIENRLLVTGKLKT